MRKFILLAIAIAIAGLIDLTVIAALVYAIYRVLQINQEVRTFWIELCLAWVFISIIGVLSFGALIRAGREKEKG